MIQERPNPLPKVSLIYDVFVEARCHEARENEIDEKGGMFSFLIPVIQDAT